MAGGKHLLGKESPAASSVPQRWETGDKSSFQKKPENFTKSSLGTPCCSWETTKAAWSSQGRKSSTTWQTKY